MATTTSRTPRDKFPNIINISLTQSAANTTTFTDIDLGFGQFERVGVKLARWEVWPEPALIQEMDADGDQANFALTADNQLSDVNPDERAVIDNLRLNALVSGTAGTAQLVELPMAKDYSQMPGGGLLVAPRPFYLGMASAGLGAARTVQCRIYFTIMKLADADYFELLESRRFYG